MALVLILALVVLLYIKTINYNYVIDDNVRREGYMYDVPLVSPSVDFWNTKPSVWYRLFMIGMHCVNTSIIYMLWGWAPALLFAVHPMSVWGVAWVTGNYYATAAYFTLIAYFFIHTFPNIWGVSFAMLMFTSALNSTVCPINFPFLFLFVGQPWGLAMFFPLVMYLRGKKFNAGIKIRYDINNNVVVRNKEVQVSYVRRFALMTKVVARYTYDCIIPNRLGFFTGFGDRLKERAEIWNNFHSFNRHFWMSLALCLSVFTAGMMINPFGILWYFVFISIHSQFNLTGQFYAQRYCYLAIIGLCIVLGTLLQAYPIVLTVVATALVIRSSCFISMWKNVGRIWLNDLETYSNNPLVYNNLAQHYLQKDNLPPYMMNYAAFLLFKGESLDPQWEVQMNIGCWFARMNMLDQCLEYTKRAAENLGKLENRDNEAMIYTKLKQQVVDLEEIIEKQKQGAVNEPAGVDIKTVPGRVTEDIPV